MRDGPIRRAIKAVARWLWRLDLGATRAWRRLRWGPTPHVLAGSCNGCGRCCERPTIATGRFRFHSRLHRRLFLAWQWHVNRFELVDEDRLSHTFVFRCHHYDPQTGRCDSYGSRPGMCRDYPRALLAAPRPELFPECGFRAVPRQADVMLAAVDRLDLPAEVRGDLADRLGVRLHRSGQPNGRSDGET